MDGEWISSATPYPPDGLDEIFGQHLPSEHTAVTDLDPTPPVNIIGDCAPSVRQVVDETLTNIPCEIEGTSAGFDSVNGFYSTIAFADNIAVEDNTLLQVDWYEETLLYENNLYSTPLSWDPPEPKVELLPPTAQAMNALTPSQQEKLANIALPQHLQYQSHQGPGTTSTKRQSISSPDRNDRENSRKHKLSVEADDKEANTIEKRYRKSLNDNIAALRDCVPSLGIGMESARGEDTAKNREELQGRTSAHKLNKATVS